MKSVFDRKWQWEIARNIPIWHSELNCRFYNMTKGYRLFDLPSFFQLRLHRGTHCDFHYPNDGKKYDRASFAEMLLRSYGQADFVSSLRPKYRKLLSKLLFLSKNLRMEVSSFKNFFLYYGLCIPTLDITAMGSKVVSERLEELLKNRPDRQQIIAYYGRQRGLVPLQKLDKEITALQRQKFDLMTAAERLYRKYCWIPANFVGEVWSVDDFAHKIKHFKIEHEKKFIKPDVKISTEIKYWARCLGEIAYLNEYRKAYFSKVNVIIRPILQGVARQNDLSGWPEMNLLTTGEILDLLRGKNNYQKSLIEDRKRDPVAFYNKNEKIIAFLSVKEILKFERHYTPSSDGRDEVSGIAASGGVARGKAKIILTPGDFSKLKSGDILVAKMTSTDFIPIMKKAGAFVTDEGGLACHAAIIAREYDKPCIIGTRIATKVLRDGDSVEVDANKGVVKKM